MYEKVKFHGKGARRRPGDLKRHGIPLVKQGFLASSRQGAKKSFLRQKLKKFPSDFAKKEDFHENHEIFMNFMILDMPEPLVFLRKYLMFFKVSSPRGGQVAKSAFLGAMRSFLRFWAPKTHFLAQNGALAAPAQK